MEGHLTVRRSVASGFSLIETIIALGVLTTGILAAAAILSAGMQKLTSSPADVVATQKAAQAVESVFAARDSHKLKWSQIRNTVDGGVFLNGPQSLTKPGLDGLVNTADDAAAGVETNSLTNGTVALTQFTREIKLQDVANENGQLRSIVVTIKYQDGPTTRTYTLATFISSYS